MSLNAYASMGNLPDDYNQLNDPGNSWEDEEDDFDEDDDFIGERIIDWDDDDEDDAHLALGW